MNQLTEFCDLDLLRHLPRENLPGSRLRGCQLRHGDVNAHEEERDRQSGRFKVFRLLFGRGLLLGKVLHWSRLETDHQQSTGVAKPRSDEYPIVFRTGDAMGTAPRSHGADDNHLWASVRVHVSGLSDFTLASHWFFCFPQAFGISRLDIHEVSLLLRCVRRVPRSLLGLVPARLRSPHYRPQREPAVQQVPLLVRLDSPRNQRAAPLFNRPFQAHDQMASGRLSAAVGRHRRASASQDFENVRKSLVAFIKHLLGISFLRTASSVIFSKHAKKLVESAASRSQPPLTTIAFVKLTI